MKKWLFLLPLLASLPLAAAECTLGGEIVPCGNFFATFGTVMLLMMLIGLVAFIFWIWMLVDCIKYEKDNKIVWVLVILLLGVLGAILYYFIVQRVPKRKKRRS